MKSTFLTLFLCISSSSFAGENCDKSYISITEDCHKISNSGLYNRYQMSYKCNDDEEKKVVFKSESIKDFFAPFKEATISYETCTDFSETLLSFDFRVSDDSVEELLKKTIGSQATYGKGSVEYIENDLLWMVLGI